MDYSRLSIFASPFLIHAMNDTSTLSEGPIRPLFFKYYFPALISILSITVHQVVNGIILGYKVGKEGLASVGLYGPVVVSLMALVLPLIIGGGILIGKNIGAANYSNAQRVFQFATTFAIAFGLIMALCSPFIVTPIAGFLAGDESASLLSNTIDYLSWQFISLPFFFLGLFWGNFIGHDGAPRISRNASLIAVTMNIALDILFIIGLDMGVKGAAIATAISLFASSLYLFIYILRGKTHFSFRDFRLTLRLSEWTELLKLGLPSFASEVSFSLGLLVISHSVVSYGPSAVAAFGIVNYASFIFIRLFTSAMIASLRIMSFNIGAKLPGRVLAVFKFGLLFTSILGIVVTALAFLFPGILVRLFSGDETGEFNLIAENAVVLYFFLFLAAGPNYVLSAYLQSTGKSGVATCMNVLKGFVLSCFFLLLLPGYFGMGLQGIWLSRSLTEIGALLVTGLFTLYYRQRYYSPDAILAKRGG